jgi:hypothetical protein
VVRILVSVTERDAPHLGELYATDAAILGPFKHALSEAGLRDIRCRRARADDVAELGSTWAKRLGIPARRPAWHLSARRP